ncbi:MAG: glycosyltransferase [Caulobacter sp.]
MISVVILTRNDAAALAQTLPPLVPAAVEGLVKELIVLDDGSTDPTVEIAADAGATILERGEAAGLWARVRAAMRGDWMLLLEPGARLEADWMTAAAAHMATGIEAVGYFRAGEGPLRSVGMAMGGTPSARAGLLVSARRLDRLSLRNIGGDHASLVRALGRRSLRRLDARML